MNIPQNCKQLHTSLAVQAEVAEKSRDLARKNCSDLASFSADRLAEITRACNVGQMGATWFVKLYGYEPHRIDMMTAEKRFKLIKGMIAGADTIKTAVTAHSRACTELTAFYPVISSAVEALDKDVDRGNAEGWLFTEAPDEATVEKQRKVYESASWFWALHARLADLQLVAEDRRIEAKELSQVTVGVLSQAIELLASIPGAPESKGESDQITEVQQQMSSAVATIDNALKTLRGMLDVAADAQRGAPAV